MSRLGKALSSADKEECYHILCVFICVCVWADWMGGGGCYPNQTAYLNKNNQSPKMEQRHRKGEIERRFDLRIRQCISAC